MALELIQIIEDDYAQAALLDHTLRTARYRTNVALDGELGLEDVKRLRPSLVLLDVMLPKLDGHEVCRQVRRHQDIATTPIIMLSALGSDSEQRASGLHLGADDYIGKPYSPKEVLSRIASILRRRQANERGSIGSDLQVIEHRMVVRYRGKQLELSLEEWRVLKCLAQAPGQVVSAEQLVASVWGHDGLIHDHELQRQAESLTLKLNQDSIRQIVLKVPGAGYQLFPSF
jgi:DNA-binding response OmpR family regulator